MLNDENALSASTASSELLPPIVTTSRTALATVSTQTHTNITVTLTPHPTIPNVFRGFVLVSVLTLSQLKSEQ